PLVGTGDSFPDSNQWALHLLNLPEAWTRHKGHAFVAALDMGLQVNHEDLIPYGYDSTGNPKLGPFRPHISRDIAFNNCGVDELEEKPNPDPTVNRAGHGTHITGVIGASTDNGRGVAGTCWDCSIQMLKISPARTAFVVGALEWVMAEGAQAVNMSFRMLEEPCTPGSKRVICNSIEKASDREILLVAAAGNDLGDIDFPAIDSRVVAVGGLEWISTQSGEPIAQFWSEEPNCPFPNDPENPKSQCGSNF
ncbi:MAG: S8 family serine peptidase, partial [bacterium]|nr:S8 family serine peptidase [bacterium]